MKLYLEDRQQRCMACHESGATVALMCDPGPGLAVFLVGYYHMGCGRRALSSAGTATVKELAPLTPPPAPET